MVKLFSVLCLCAFLITSCSKENESELLPEPENSEIQKDTVLIVYKWNDIIAINNDFNTNGGYEFVSYQWYLEGAMIDDAKGGKSPYISLIKSDLPYNKEYYCEMKTKEGGLIKTPIFVPTK